MMRGMSRVSATAAAVFCIAGCASGEWPLPRDAVVAPNDVLSVEDALGVLDAATVPDVPEEQVSPTDVATPPEVWVLDVSVQDGSVEVVWAPDVAPQDTMAPDVAWQDAAAPDVPLLDAVEATEPDLVAIADGASDHSEPPDSSAQDVPEPPLDVTTDLADVPEVVPLCSPIAPAVLPADYTLAVGPALSGMYTPAVPGGSIEVTQGPQGGIHLSLGFKVTLPATWTGTSIKVEVAATTFAPCCAENVVGGFYNAKFLVAKAGEEPGAYAAGNVAAIFQQSDAALFKDKPCCVRLTVGVYEGTSVTPTLNATATETFQCVDVF